MFFSIRARAEPPRPLDCNKHFCANRVVYDRSRRGCRAHEEAEGGSAPSNHVARWYNHLARVWYSSSCCGNMLLWHLEFFLRHVIILVVSGPSKADRRETRATARLSMIIVRAQRVWRVTFDAQQDFSTHGASFISAVEPPTSRVVRRRPTWPSASRVRAGSAWSGWARWDRQRTMYTRASPAAHPEPSKVEHFR